MPSYGTILSATLPVFLVVGVGFLFQRRGWLSEETEIGMMKIVLNLLIPCLILSLIPGNPSLDTISSAAWAIGLGFGLILAGLLVAWLGGLAGGMRTGSGLRTFTISSGIQNYGFLPLPILVELFPNNPGPSGLVFVFGMGVEIAMWTVGLTIMNGKAGLRAVFNGPFLAVMAALLLNYTGGHRLVPEVATTTMEMLGRCAVPMSVFMIGATMGRFSREGIFNDVLRVGVAGVVVRLGIHAALILAAAVFLPISPDLRALLVVQAGMPAAIFPIVLVRLFGGHTQMAIQVVLTTSLVSLVTAPLVIAMGLKWIGN
jgi:malate permease and related proteins